VVDPAKAGRLTGLGATVAGRVEEFGQRWTVMPDPGSNEFCLSWGAVAWAW